MKKQLVYTILICIFSIVAHAQETNSEQTVLYVTDQLRLSLYAEADAKSNILSYLGSGDKLIVEEVAGPYAKVIVPSGKEGWVKRGFLVSKPTANLLLIEMAEENKQLENEIDKLSNSKLIIDQYESDMNAMSATIETLEQQKQSSEAMVTALNQEAQVKAEKAEKESARPAIDIIIKMAIIYWHYIVIGVLVIILIGFLIGKRATENSIKRKFHGIKVW